MGETQRLAKLYTHTPDKKNPLNNRHIVIFSVTVVTHKNKHLYKCLEIVTAKNIGRTEV